jgi:hypothetical protein
LFSPGTLVSSTNNTDRHDITEILLKYHNPYPTAYHYLEDAKTPHLTQKDENVKKRNMGHFFLVLNSELRQFAISDNTCFTHVLLLNTKLRIFVILFIVCIFCVRCGVFASSK